MQSDTADLAIVGGGAAGLAAAIFAAKAAPSGLRIVVLDGAKMLGAKILVSGGGRCNVTHHEVFPTDFNGSQNIVRNILSEFDVAATIRWFASLGVELKREPSGKLFPVANSAPDAPTSWRTPGLAPGKCSNPLFAGAHAPASLPRRWPEGANCNPPC